MTGQQATLSAYEDDPRPTQADLERLGRVDGTVLQTLMIAARGPDAGWVDRWTLQQETQGAVIHSSISRLRDRGYRIDSRRKPGEEDSGAWQYRYQRRADAEERGSRSSSDGGGNP